MLLFTARKSTLPRGVDGARNMPPVKFAIYFNVLGIILLAGPSETFSKLSSREDPKDFGVESILERDDLEESDHELGDDPLI